MVLLTPWKEVPKYQYTDILTEKMEFSVKKGQRRNAKNLEVFMFKWLKKDPLKKKESEIKKIYEQAVSLQRNGDIRAYSKKIAEVEKLQQELDCMKNVMQT